MRRRGGCIACDGNGEDECVLSAEVLAKVEALAAMQPTNGAIWPKEGRGLLRRDGGSGCRRLSERRLI